MGNRYVTTGNVLRIVYPNGSAATPAGADGANGPAGGRHSAIERLREVDFVGLNQRQAAISEGLQQMLSRQARLAHQVAVSCARIRSDSAKIAEVFSELRAGLDALGVLHSPPIEQEQFHAGSNPAPSGPRPHAARVGGE